MDETSPVIDFAGMVNTTAKNLRNLVREVQNNPHDLEILKVKPLLASQII